MRDRSKYTRLILGVMSIICVVIFVLSFLDVVPKSVTSLTCLSSGTPEEECYTVYNTIYHSLYHYIFYNTALMVVFWVNISIGFYVIITFVLSLLKDWRWLRITGYVSFGIYIVIFVSVLFLSYR